MSHLLLGALFVDYPTRVASSIDPQMRRKPSRETNIAKRRVTHVAVERQTRDTQRALP